MYDRITPSSAVWKAPPGSVERDAQAIDPSPRPWTLALDLVDPARLAAVLSDGLWHCDFAHDNWPPVDRRALPRTIVEALRRVGGDPLRLQLPLALDPWPWERELAACGRRAVASRYLTDLASTVDAASPTPLVVATDRAGGHWPLVRAARLQMKPVVVVDTSMSDAQRGLLERCLRSHWRSPISMSDALARTLHQLDLAPDSCRLYGDGLASTGDAEQGWRPVTVMSVDLVGSTALLHALGAEAYSRRLRTYYQRCHDVIVRFQGSLDTFHGDDGLMGYFGFPLALEDAAGRALSAAWALSHELADLHLDARIGVASGRIAVSAQQRCGTEVHLAARLQSAAAPGQILVAASTRERVGSRFRLEAVPEGVKLKDFGDQVAVYRLTGSAAAGRLAIGEGGKNRFVGRHRELTALRDAWAAAYIGRMQRRVIQGEAGVGKSRLLHEFSQELRAAGNRCLCLSGLAQAVNSPFAAVVDALRHYWDIDQDLAGEQLRARLVDLPLLTMNDDDLEELTNLLLQSRRIDRLSPPGGHRRWSELLLDCLRAIIEAGPICLLVDDAHWLDPSSIDLLRRVCEVCAGRPLLVVSGERADPGRRETFTTAQPLELLGLSDSEAQQMARELGADLPERVRQRIVARAEGIPLYLEESMRMLSQRATSSDGDVPAKLEDLLMVRLDDLGPDRMLAQVASMLGREFSAAHLEALLSQDDPFVKRAKRQGDLASLVSTGLLQKVDGPVPGYRFKHVLLRDAAYGSIWAQDRERLHGRCADLIESSTPKLSKQRPESVARHLEAAGRFAEAWRAWLAAAQLAASRHAHEEALELARHVLTLQANVPDDHERTRGTMQLHLLAASAHIALQGYGSAEVEAAYQEAERASLQLKDRTDAVRIRLGLEACYVMRGDLPRAAELAQAGVAATDWNDHPRVAMQARWALANVRFHQGDWVAALSGFDECLSHYRFDVPRRSGVQDPAVMCLGYSAWIHFELGQANEALRRIARMLELAETLQHPFSTGVACGFAASIKRLCGDIDGAWPHALEAVRVCERGGFQVWLAHAWMVRGQLQHDRGDIARGNEDMDRGFGLWVGGGARISCATYLTTRAELFLREGLTERASADLGTALNISQQIGENYYRAETLRLQGLCAWQAHDLSRAERTLTKALRRSTREGKPGLALRCALSLGALQARQGRSHTAAARLRKLLEASPQHDACRDSRWALEALYRWDAGETFASSAHTPWEPR